jgi:hypothetical protein
VLVAVQRAVAGGLARSTSNVVRSGVNAARAGISRLDPRTLFGNSKDASRSILQTARSSVSGWVRNSKATVSTLYKSLGGHVTRAGRSITTAAGRPLSAFRRSVASTLSTSFNALSSLFAGSFGKLTNIAKGLAGKAALAIAPLVFAYDQYKGAQNAEQLTGLSDLTFMERWGAGGAYAANEFTFGGADWVANKMGYKNAAEMDVTARRGISNMGWKDFDPTQYDSSRLNPYNWMNGARDEKNIGPQSQALTDANNLLTASALKTLTGNALNADGSLATDTLAALRDIQGEIQLQTIEVVDSSDDTTKATKSTAKSIWDAFKKSVLPMLTVANAAKDGFDAASDAWSANSTVSAVTTPGQSYGEGITESQPSENAKVKKEVLSRMLQPAEKDQISRELHRNNIVGGVARAPLADISDADIEKAQTSAASGSMDGGALGNVIAKGEGGYNSFNRGFAGDARGAQIDFSKMSLREVMAQQALPKRHPNRLLAIGKYQIIPKTMEGAVSSMGIDVDQPFTPELQEKIARDYLFGAKRPQIKNYVTGESDNLEAALLATAREFASVADPRTGRTVYGGVGNNKASTSSKKVAAALQAERAKYQASIAAGMTPEQAWSSLSGSGEPGYDYNKFSTLVNPDGQKMSISLPQARSESDAYKNIPAAELDQFKYWNSDPIANDEKHLKSLDPKMQEVVTRARELLPDQKFVVGSGIRTEEQQKNAVKWGWSKTMDTDHYSGRTADMWPIGKDGAISFDKDLQMRVVTAMEQAAKEKGIQLDVGARWKNFKDRPHFALKEGEGTEGYKPKAIDPATGESIAANRVKTQSIAVPSAYDAREEQRLRQHGKVANAETRAAFAQSQGMMLPLGSVGDSQALKHGELIGKGIIEANKETIKPPSFSPPTIDSSGMMPTSEREPVNSSVSETQKKQAELKSIPDPTNIPHMDELKMMMATSTMMA